MRVGGCGAKVIETYALRRYPPEQTIRSIKLYHRQIYSYAFHRPKLERVRDGTLDEKREGDTHFALLPDFLERIPITCPHDLFQREDDPKARACRGGPISAARCGAASVPAFLRRS
jgi:hypothetical protein